MHLNDIRFTFNLMCEIILRGRKLGRNFRELTEQMRNNRKKNRINILTKYIFFDIINLLNKIITNFRRKAGVKQKTNGDESLFNSAPCFEISCKYENEC